jgi:predicted glycogen debranching enzyme
VAEERKQVAAPQRTTGSLSELDLATLRETAQIEFGRDTCGSLEIAELKEWLVTNAIGGYASGTVSGNLTRRYHGLLLAALKPPVGRTQLVAKLDETVRYDGVEYPLSTNRWASGAIQPEGYLNIESFRLEGTIPVWHFAFGDALLAKRIWMEQGENTTYVRYTLLRATRPVQLECKALVNYRDFHSSTHAGNWQMQIEPVDHGARIVAFEGATPFYLLTSDAECSLRHEWYHNCYLPRERYRGLDDQEDHLLAAIFSRQLGPTQSVTFALTTNEKPELDGTAALVRQIEHEKNLFSNWTSSDPRAATRAPAWIRQLVLAADQFVVNRALPEQAEGRSIIAGYHWFGDWGRDTMIAFPGLTLATGRTDIAKKILLAFSRYVDAGMLPNDFPDAGGKPEYNTVDAALWFFQAVRQYFDETKDADTVAKLYPILARIISAHLRGTRYNIHVDDSDGLLFAGEPGVQLTWMDAKVGDWVVTPRIGKPVEINALWYNALKTMANFAPLAGKSATPFQKMATRVKQNFTKFWNLAAGYCYDVIDTPETGNDATLRPNQIFAVSLPESPLSPERQKSVVDICAQRLLTSHGLRSLSIGEPGYRGQYRGGPRERDGAYHQGTTWGWLLGPFVFAHLRVYGDPKAATNFLEPLGKQISSHGLGTLSEIFDGDAPFTPRGCIAQAWTVGEILRAWRATLA